MLELCFLIGLSFVLSILFIVVFFVLGLCHSLMACALLLFWFSLFCLVLGIALRPIRRLLFTCPFWRLGQKMAPKIGQTEREALEAGAVWWEGELFKGSPNWAKLEELPIAELTEADHAFLNHEVRELCRQLEDWKIVHEQMDMPESIWTFLKEARFFGMAIEKQYGGLGFSALMQSTVVSMIATRSLSAAVNVMVPNSLGPGELITQYGTPAQQAYYLPRLATGEEIPCFALTSLAGGSDATAMEDYGVICRGDYQGKSIIGMKVTFNKRYITLAPIATLIGLAIKLYDPDRLLGEQYALGITVCLVPRETPGIVIGERHYPVFQAFLNGPVSGDEVFMPLDFIIGGEAKIGQGWAMLMACLAVGRGVSLPALNVGASKLCYRMSGAYAKLRQQFGCSIGEFEGIQTALAEISGFNYLMEAARIMTVSGIDSGAKPALCAAIVKYHCTELGRRVLNHAMDVHAGRTIQAGPRNYLLSAFVAAPLGITIEGANILTRNLIIFGQGAIRCHPYLYEEMAAMAEPDTTGFERFDQLLLKHGYFFIKNIARGFLFGLGFRHLLCRGVTRGSPTARYAYQLTRLSTALAVVTDVTLGVLGGKIKRMENLSARLGDLLSYLYLASTVLKYYHAKKQDSEVDQLHLRFAMGYCIYQAQEALMGFFSNFPKRRIALFIRFLLFPFGRRYSPPNDQLLQQLATHMMQTSAFRDRLTQYCYIGETLEDPTGCVEIAFQKMLEVAPLLEILHQANKANKFSPGLNSEAKLLIAQQQDLLTVAQCQALREFFVMQRTALEVDVFSADYFDQPIGECRV